METVAQILKKETKSLHHTLDHQPLLQRLANGSFSLQDYVSCINLFKNCYLQLDSALAESEQRIKLVAGIQPYQPRVPWLMKEYDLLGVNRSAVSSQQINSISGMSAGEYWGARYVLEGSCHGAVVMQRIIKAQLKQLNCNSTAPFWQHLALLAVNWAPLTDALEAQLHSKQLLESAIHKAKQVFTLFIEQAMKEINQPTSPMLIA